LCFSTYNYGSEKTLSSFFSNQAYKTYETLKILSCSILYHLNYIFHIAWYKIFKPREEELFEAIKNENSIATHIILTYPHINPNYVSPNHYSNNSLLHKACSHRDLQTVKKLLSFDRIKPNIFDNNNHTPLYNMYNRHNSYPNLLEIITILIKHPKTDINKTIEYSTVLSWACEMGHTDIVKLLLDRKDINVHRGNYIDTYLRIAHKKGHKEIFDMLCEHPLTDPLEIFTIAVENGDVTLVAKLLKNQSLDSYLCLTKSPLYIAYTSHYCNRNANLEIIKMLVVYPKTYINTIVKQSTVLRWACEKDHTDIVKLLLNRHDIEVNYKGYEYSCLRLSHNKGHTETFKMLSTHPTIDPIELFAIALESGYEEIIKKLLKKHQLSTLEGLNKDSLSKAAKTGNIEIFKLLLKYQSIPINHDAYNTALYEAVKYGNEALVQLLLTIPNIHIHKKNAREKTPFCLAIEMNNIPIAQLLYNHINNIVNEYFLDGNTPLIFAAHKKNIDMINFLIDICKVNLSLKDDNNATFFHHLATGDKLPALEQLNFFNNYSDTQKKQFINTQLQSFVYIQLPDNEKQDIPRIVYPFINYCKQYGGNLNQRLDKHDRPVDAAHKILTLLAQYTTHDSAQFIIKEKIYHAFLNQTDAMPEDQLHFMLKYKLGLNLDIKNNIMRYYYAVTIDQKIISLIITKPNIYGSYYEKNNRDKRILKENALNETYKSLGYPTTSNLYA